MRKNPSFFKRKRMPSASQFIQIKRLQTGINGKLASTKTLNKRANDTYDGYAGTSLITLPPNALLSNKFIVTPGGGGGGGGGSATYTITMNTALGTTDQKFEGSIPISDSTFTLHFEGTALSGYVITGFSVVFTPEVSITSFNIDTGRAGLDINIIIGKGVTDIQFSSATTPSTIQSIDDIVFSDIPASLTATNVIIIYANV
jgi:hypothetical protein